MVEKDGKLKILDFFVLYDDDDDFGFVKFIFDLIMPSEFVSSCDRMKLNVFSIRKINYTCKLEKKGTKKLDCFTCFLVKQKNPEIRPGICMYRTKSNASKGVKKEYNFRKE